MTKKVNSLTDSTPDMKKAVCGVIASLLIASSAFGVDPVQVEDEYTKAKACLGEIKLAPVKSASHGAWERCVGLFEGVNKKYPETEKGTQALFSAGRIRAELYPKFHKPQDAEVAIKIFNQFIRQYPKNTLTDDALYHVGRLRHNPMKDDERAMRAFGYLIENYPDGDMAPKAREALASLTKAKGQEKPPVDETEIAAGPVDEVETPPVMDEKPAKGAPFVRDVAGPGSVATLEAIDIEKGETETSVVLRLSRKVFYSLSYTGEGRHTKSPPRLDILLTYTKSNPALAKYFSVASDNLTRIRVKRDILGGGTRVIFEMTPKGSYKVLSKDSSVILRFGPHGRQSDIAPSPQPTSKGKIASARVEMPKKDMVIVVDPGHGGQDTGAIGPGGLKEKDISLAIAKNLALKLKQGLNAKVYLTRTSDVTLTLEERNKFASVKKADLFISIHTNASTDRKTSGIETYFLNNASDAAAAKLAKRENKSAGKKLSDVEHILSTMLQNYDTAESELLATDVQRSIVSHVGKRYRAVKNRRVRSALFYVLVGAKCPAILVESSFISNPMEAKRLKDKRYQGDLATGIANGVTRYIKGGDKRMVRL